MEEKCILENSLNERCPSGKMDTERMNEKVAFEKKNKTPFKGIKRDSFETTMQSIVQAEGKELKREF